MDLKPETRRDLKEAKAELLRQVAAIDALLGEEPEAKATRPARKKSPIVKTGLRKEIKATLAEIYPRGLKPKGIAGKIEKRGFTDKAKTPLSTRVGNECWRMAKDGGSLRSSNGRYYLKAPTPQERPQPHLVTTTAQGGSSA